jgi:K+-sensing histidine kinase KdpD
MLQKALKVGSPQKGRPATSGSMALSPAGVAFGEQNYLRGWIAPILVSIVTILLVSLLLSKAADLAVLHLWDDPEDLALAYILPTIFITMLFGSNMGLLSVLISGLAAAYFIYPPEFNIQIDRPEHLVELSFFLMLSVTACKATAVLTDEKRLNRRLMRKLLWRQSVLQKLGPRDHNFHQLHEVQRPRTKYYT